MKKLILLAISSIAFITTAVFAANSSIIDFSKGKKILDKEIYNTGSLRVDNYCGCGYDKNGKVDLKSCGYQVASSGMKSRAKSIEWEHVVPAENFGRTFAEWRDGNKQLCGSKKGRDCAGKVDEFKTMEGDIYNLIPVIGEVNGRRSNLQYGMNTSSEPTTFGSCTFKIDREEDVAEPMNQVKNGLINTKGMTARISLYFADQYSTRYTLSDKQRQLFNAWNSMYPVTKYECEVTKKKENSIKREMKITKDQCISAGLW